MARSSNNNLNYGKVTEESVTSVPRKSIVADSEIDYGRQSILGRTKITKSDRREKNTDQKLDDQVKTTGACCNTKCLIF